MVAFTCIYIYIYIYIIFFFLGGVLLVKGVEVFGDLIPGFFWVVGVMVWALRCSVVVGAVAIFGGFGAF